MVKISSVDLEFLYLGIKNNGRFNETDIAKSELKNLGTGKILDSLASLSERKLISVGDDGGFLITDLGKNTLWDSKTPLWAKILKLLEIKSLQEEKISYYLNKDFEEISTDLEKIRKGGFVMRTPLRVESKIEKMYEILPEGMELLQKKLPNNFPTSDFETNQKLSSLEIKEIIEELKESIENQDTLGDKDKQKILENLEKLENGF